MFHNSHFFLNNHIVLMYFWTSVCRGTGTSLSYWRDCNKCGVPCAFNMIFTLEFDLMPLLLFVCWSITASQQQWRLDTLNVWSLPFLGWKLPVECCDTSLGEQTRFSR